MRSRFALATTLGLWLTGCQNHAALQASMAADESLINTYWKLLTVNDDPVVAADNVREAHIVLHIDNSARLAGATGCNTLSGRYQHTRQQLTFHPIVTTKMTCPAALMHIEKAMLSALYQTTHWKIHGERLVLFNDKGEPLAGLRAVHLY
ncbi:MULTISPECIES: META domain-containing protein [unclassified Halomonas]|uniref:META domain-containing protein n=1 Tax=Halomonadaceae TaxID=28256 RepID=UPI001EF7342E|nr:MULTISPECIES: META domain-containing protein [unclassified Halomonas]MCG7577861.1 META domain-containing protein [Halomonas sp. MMH1-48]MCG7591054.1 META domain-containing protein [Halomonas sp. McD50-5]MCG7604927.1 META domain-containing protein [Halomonas sp. MM17-34]MCG7614107.1 META domain-containing protein [Halomonas sp. MM17-29]MCG7617282.1 META domain-containing protein [Halomonas sp. McD50-4]